MFEAAWSYAHCHPGQVVLVALFAVYLIGLPAAAATAATMEAMGVVGSLFLGIATGSRTEIKPTPTWKYVVGVLLWPVTLAVGSVWIASEIARDLFRRR